MLLTAFAGAVKNLSPEIWEETISNNSLTKFISEQSLLGYEEDLVIDCINYGGDNFYLQVSNNLTKVRIDERIPFRFEKFEKERLLNFVNWALAQPLTRDVEEWSRWVRCEEGDEGAEWEEGEEESYYVKREFITDVRNLTQLPTAFEDVAVSLGLISNYTQFRGFIAYLVEE